MKIGHSIFLLLCAFCIGFGSCKKDTDPNMETFKIVKEMEKITVETNSATISGTYQYSGKINGIKVRVGTSEQLFGSDVFVAEVNGKAYSVNITGLQSGTLYHYRYEVDLGSKEDFLTEISDFTTLNELPTVKTIDVTAIDTTVFRIKCEVLSDGGLEVTERGICWNTYGDPTLEDASMKHTNGGLGPYTLRMENLAIETKYYVRAYAMNAAGVGYGEELVFETTPVPGMSVNIALSCNPEEGGTVNGAGPYAIGEQCTVKATANPTYTFVNWTENGTQVSTNASYTFTVTGSRSLVANFTNSGGGGGSDAPQGAINGKFTINDGGGKVYFSRGNLQYIGSATTPYWKFADTQWGFLGVTTGQNSASQNVDRDLFGWGTSGWNCGNLYFQPWNCDETGESYGPSGGYDLVGTYANSDWGQYNAISNGGNISSQWRTLTKTEWWYILYTRNTNSGIRYAMATVGSARGLIVLPDDWNSTYYTLNEINNGNANFSSNIITTSQWSILEQYGAVFLPSAGSREGTVVSNAGNFGNYWSATAAGGACAWVLCIGGGSITDHPADRFCGFSVRLVCPSE